MRLMIYEGDIRRIDFKTARVFYRTLDLNGFEPAMHTLNHTQHLDPEQPCIITLLDNGDLEVDFLTKPLPYNTIRRLLTY